MLSYGLSTLSYTSYCILSFDDYFRNNNLENLCVQFKYLYNLVFETYDEYSSMKKENIEYLNYWLNKQLKSKKILSTSVEEFYQKLITIDISFDSEKKFINKIHEIKDEDLEKMNILYDLNDIYHNIKITSYDDEQTCIDYSNKCVKKFTDAKEFCSTDKKDKYCEALKSFKNKYEEYNGDDMFGGCNKKYLSKLPLLTEENKHSAILNEPAADTRQLESHPEKIKDQDLGIQGDLEKERQKSTNLMQPPFSPAGENNNDNNISIFTIFGIILSISVFSTITYKFTPFGSWINRRLKRNKIKWRSVEDEKETERLLEHNYDPKQLVSRDVPYSVSYNSL